MASALYQCLFLPTILWLRAPLARTTGRWARQPREGGQTRAAALLGSGARPRGVESEKPRAEVVPTGSFIISSLRELCLTLHLGPVLSPVDNQRGCDLLWRQTPLPAALQC